MKKDSFYRVLGGFIVAVILLMMAMALIGCRTVDVTKSNSAVDSTATQVKATDSSTYNLIEVLYKYGKASEKEYTPGRDTTIIMPNGEVQVIQLPGQLIRERVVETGEGSTRKEEAKSFSSTDSLMIEFIKSQSSKDKETSGVPITIVLGLAIFFILLFAGLIVYLKFKK